MQLFRRSPLHGLRREVEPLPRRVQLRHGAERLWRQWLRGSLPRVDRQLGPRGRSPGALRLGEGGHRGDLWDGELELAQLFILFKIMISVRRRMVTIMMIMIVMTMTTFMMMMMMIIVISIIIITMDDDHNHHHHHHHHYHNEIMIRIMLIIIYDNNMIITI